MTSGRPTALDLSRTHEDPFLPEGIDPIAIDRHRIISSTAFRRLEHKTQVFSPALHDHFRSRLTHTLEVASIARLIAARVGATEPLAEAIALAHDLGHAPFGHAGERALDELLADHGGFNHNMHALRVVEYLEHPFPPFRGLNLTAAVRAGLAAHETAYDVPETSVQTNEQAQPGNAAASNDESEAASIADRIAYALHDLEDAIGAGLLSGDDLGKLALWRRAAAHIAEPLSTGASAPNVFRTRRIILDQLLFQVLATLTRDTDGRLSLSAEINEDLQPIESLLLERVYRSPEVAEADANARDAITALFNTYRKDPAQLPERFRDRIDEQGLHVVIRDYIAGMTDRYAHAQLERLTT